MNKSTGSCCGNCFAFSHPKIPFLLHRIRERSSVTTMKGCYLVSLILIGLAKAASIGRRDGSPCALVSQSADAALAELSGYKLEQGLRLMNLIDH
jgi:hypothetical protein